MPGVSPTSASPPPWVSTVREITAFAGVILIIGGLGLLLTATSLGFGLSLMALGVALFIGRDILKERFRNPLPIMPPAPAGHSREGSLPLQEAAGIAIRLRPLPPAPAGRSRESSLPLQDDAAGVAIRLRSLSSADHPDGNPGASRRPHSRRGYRRRPHVSPQLLES